MFKANKWASNQTNTYMQVTVIIQFSSIFKPNDFWSRLSFCNANENNFMAKYVFIVKMGCFGDACSLEQIMKYENAHILLDTFSF